ncbi:MAG: hypothetical protein B7X34_11005 [Acidobacteriia bacterium 12-62-4]|nr:MAG: hypothetical protein B7X34_11005 [Acidobacteriia bacterium 12-62-4]
MNTFPLLKSGAIMQWPATRERQFATEVLAFSDGSEQRYRNFSQSTRRWIIRLDDLDEEELATMEAFYAQEQGGFGTFSFTDPWDGAVYAECQFDNQHLQADYQDIHRGRTTLVIRAVR